jgi:glucan phosphoethanolaminetransferase (alkaline phosphatase superfamily)
MRINTLFFAFYFFAAASVHILHVFLAEPFVSSQTCLAAGLCALQTLTETALLMGLSWVIQTYAPKALWFYVCGVFFLLLGHLIDLPLTRLVNMSFWYAIQFLMLESYGNFIELLIASNVSMKIWALVFASLAGLISVAFFLYKMTGRLSKKLSLQLKGIHVGILIATGGMFLLMGELFINLSNEKIVGALPWKHALFCKEPLYLTLNHSLKGNVPEEVALPSTLEHTPDIYLIIVESLRRDFITREITPHLDHLREQSLYFPVSLSNANFTHGAWFSLFQSAFPFQWHPQVEEEYAQGSLPLRLLKDRGYTIHVFSAPRLSYYKMNHIIFGEKEELADTLFTPDEKCTEPYLRDECVVEKLLLQTQEKGSGRLFILFLDAPHFDYSWPQQLSPFTPFEPQVNFLKLAFTNTDIVPLINRYKNALHSTDRLLGTLFNHIDKEAVIILTGDHGQEFYENGNLFHTSALSAQQLEVPIFYRFGEKGTPLSAASTHMTCHMDIFPSLLHYLTGEQSTSDGLQGQSIFAENRWPFTVSARFNASQTPSEYCIHNGSHKLLFSFETPTTLKILGFKTKNDETLSYAPSELQEEFAPALDALRTSK